MCPQFEDGKDDASPPAREAHASASDSESEAEAPTHRSPVADDDEASSDGDMGRGGDSRHDAHDPHRLEYEEEEEGVPLKREVVDAHVQLPDVPKLKGTDGQVSRAFPRHGIVR